VVGVVVVGIVDVLVVVDVVVVEFPDKDPLCTVK
jgi:hypothetical protein